MLTIFSRLAAGEEMPVREKIRVRRGRPAAHRPRRARRTRAGAQPARNRAACTRGWAGSRPCWCWGRSSPPHCSPPRWPSTPAATRPAAGRWERRAPRPPSRIWPTRAGPDALEATGAFVVALAARRSWFCCHQPFAVLLSSSGAVPGWLTWPRWAGSFVDARLSVLRHAASRLCAGLPPGPGLVGRWGPADRPCGICGLLSLWPLGRCRTGRVIPSVGGVPGLPALPIEGTRDDRGREP